MSKAELSPHPGHSHSHFGPWTPSRSKSSFHEWSPKNLHFQESEYSPPAKHSELPASQYSSPWRPVGNLDRQSSGYRPEAPRYPEFTPPQIQQLPPISDEPSPPPAPISTQLTRFPVHPVFNPTPNRFGAPQVEASHHQAPGFHQHQNFNHEKFLPSSYDVPLYAPMYEPGPNEEYNQAYMQLPLDWASLANALSQPPSTPGPQRPPNHRYKIVFIKTPRIPGLHPPTTPPPPPPPDQEKTLIYVLINKPEFDPATTPAPPPSTTPSKPEVYFIQYKTKANQLQTGNKIETGNSGAGQGLYEGQDMNQHRYGSTTFTKSVEVNSL